MERRLAAIIVADVVGYSRLMRADEAGTLAAVENRRKDMIEPLVAKHRGRIVKLMGDGVLMEFASAVGAIQCAVEIQAAMDAANEDLAEDRRINMRIGVNLGDVIVRDDDVYGDGVNIAAGLETLAEPGSITLSQAVFDQVRGKVPFEFEDLGELSLKNIPEPTRVHQISRRSASTGGVSHAAPSPKPAPAKPSIVIVPFTNMSGDPEQDYFSDGITEDIITDLSQVSAIFVIARHTAFTFKGRPMESSQLARQLKVGYVLEGSVRKAGNWIRITAKLIDGATGGHLWAKRFDRNFADIFALQDEISKNVVAALRLKLLPEELKAITTRPTANAQAYKFYLQARAKLAVSWGTKEYLRAARRLFAKALKADPGYARAYVGIADCDAFLWANGDLDVSLEHMLANSGRALELAPNLAEAHASRGVALYVAGHPEEAMEAFERAIGLESDLYEAHYFYGFCCRDTGDFKNAAVHFERAAELQPRNYQPLTLLSEIHLVLGHPDRSAAAARQAISCIEKEFGRDPEVAEVLGMGAATMVYLGENARAEKWVNRAVLLDPESYSVRYNAACTYAVLGKLDQAQESLEFAFSHAPRIRGWLLGIAKHDTQLDPLRQRSDFQDLIKRLEGNAAAPS
jgi:adenylate cyclase